MFRRAMLHLTGPICGCEVEDLMWAIAGDKEPGLQVGCRRCGTQFVVPHAQFRAGFVFEKPYPKPKTSKPAADKIEAKDIEADKFLREVLGLAVPGKK